MQRRVLEATFPIPERSSIGTVTSASVVTSLGPLTWNIKEAKKHRFRNRTSSGQHELRQSRYRAGYLPPADRNKTSPVTLRAAVPQNQE